MRKNSPLSIAMISLFLLLSAPVTYGAGVLSLVPRAPTGTVGQALTFDVLLQSDIPLSAYLLDLQLDGPGVSAPEYAATDAWSAASQDSNPFVWAEFGAGSVLLQSALIGQNAEAAYAEPTSIGSLTVVPSSEGTLTAGINLANFFTDGLLAPEGSNLGITIAGPASVEIQFGDELVWGDVNDNGRVDIGDALFIQQFLAGLRPEADMPRLDLADVNNNDRVDIGDALFIQQYLAGLRDTLGPLPPAMTAVMAKARDFSNVNSGVVLTGWLRPWQVSENTVTFLVDGGPFGVGESGEARLVANVGDQSVAAYDFRITYDPAVFQIGAVGAGDLGQPVANTAVAGEILLNGFTLSPLSGEVHIATVAFTVVGNPGNQTSSAFSLEIRDLGDENFSPVDAEALPASIPLQADEEPIPPTPTETPVEEPTATPEPVEPTPTPEEPVEPTPTETPVEEPTPTPEATATPEPGEPTPTETPVEPTPTEEPVEPTPTETPVEPTPTEEPVEPTPTETSVEPTPTPVEPEPPTPTPTEEPVEPTPTEEPVEPTPTEEPVEPTPTEEPVEPTVTPTPTPEVVEPTPTPIPVEPGVGPASGLLLVSHEGRIVSRGAVSGLVLDIPELKGLKLIDLEIINDIPVVLTSNGEIWSTADIQIDGGAGAELIVGEILDMEFTAGTGLFSAIVPGNGNDEEPDNGDEPGNGENGDGDFENEIALRLSDPDQAGLLVLDRFGNVRAFNGALYHGHVGYEREFRYGSVRYTRAFPDAADIEVAHNEAGGVGYYILSRTGDISAFGGVPELPSISQLEHIGAVVSFQLILDDNGVARGYKVLNHGGYIIEYTPELGFRTVYGFPNPIRTRDTDPLVVDFVEVDGQFYVLNELGAVYGPEGTLTNPETLHDVLGRRGYFDIEAGEW